MTNGYAQWAPQYRAKLWTGVLPLPPNAKAPTPKGYTGRAGKTPDDDQIAAWCRQRANGNIALRMPGDVLGIDVDDYAYERWEEDENGEAVKVRGVKTGAATLAALEAELGPLPATWRSSSRGDGPSGIRLFRVPPGLLWGDFGTHLEGIWWGHRYAVVYPSVNPDSGLQYLWINDGAEQPRWGAEPPKITELSELPESWTARFGRSADAPKATAAAAREGRTVPLAATSSPNRGDRRRFTRQEAADFVQPHLDTLRRAAVGEINNRLNDAAKVISHFIPVFWSPLQAQVLLMDALSATAYDHPQSAQNTVQSALNSAVGDWQAELRAERPAAATVHPYAAAPVADAGGGGEPPTDDGMGDAIGGFWQRRPILGLIEQYARSKYVAPWAVLGAVLARVSASVEPNIQIPDIIGDNASLNLFVALVGQSGGGKDVAFGVAKRMLDVRFGLDPITTSEIPLGSGEGLAHIYLKRPKPLTKRKKAADDPDSETIGLSGLTGGGDEPIQYRTRALVTISEIDTLDAIASRKGSTLGGQVRQAWSGKQIGFMYADETRRMMVPEHSYRMSIIAGVQPGRAGALMAESDGGTPQRFLWLPATDPTLVRDAPPTPGVLEWTPPIYTGGGVTVMVCEQARETIIQAAIDRNSGKLEALDGHALLTRLKVAVALAMLTGEDPTRQMTVTEEDWELSGVVMAVSDRTRAAIMRHLADAAREQNVKQATAKAYEAITINETVENDATRKAMKWVRGKIGSEWVKYAKLRDDVGRNKNGLSDAIDALVASGEIESQEYTGSNGRSGREFRRVGSAE